MNKSLNVCLINALYFLTPKEIRILTQTNKKLKKQISENKKLWIHFIESKYGSLKECIHQMYYIPYSFLSYNAETMDGRPTYLENPSKRFVGQFFFVQ
jgi:hypothetical protein